MSFTNAPVTRGLVLGLAATSIAASLFDAKHYFYILVDTHFLRYHQAWRVLLYQLCYTNSTEVLFASMTLYNMRVVERMWGSRKYAVSFLFPFPFSHPGVVRLRGGFITSTNSGTSPSSSPRPASQPSSRPSSLLSYSAR